MNDGQAANEPRHPYQRIAAELRTAVQGGQYQPGDRLPSYGELADAHDTTMTTVKRALDVLRHEGLIVTRQGSGSYVAEPKTERTNPVGVRSHLEVAIHADAVTIDVDGIAVEALHDALGEVLAGGAAPRSVRLRLVLDRRE